MEQTSPPPSSSILKYNPQLYGLRFIAIFFVLCYHWIPSLHHSKLVGSFSWLINFFFVLSSYLITRILISAKEKGAAAGATKGRVMWVFLIRRTIRIFPPYYLYLLLLLVIPRVGSEVASSPGWYFSYLANYHIFQLQEFSSVTAHIWTLAVEEQFYFIWPFIILFVPQRNLLKIFLFIIVASVAVRAAFYQPLVGISMKILTQYCADAFAVGSIMAYKYTLATEKEKLAITKWFKMGMYISIPVSLFFVFSESDYMAFIFSRLLFSVVSYAVIEGAVKLYQNFFGKFLQHKAVVYIGRISYGIYLYHLLVPIVFWRSYSYVKHFFKSHYTDFFERHSSAIGKFEIVIASQVGCFVIYSVVVIITASLSAKYIEGPINKFKIGYTASPVKYHFMQIFRLNKNVYVKKY